MALTDSLISYWKLDEASGSRADSHGSNTLTDNNTVGSATGKVGTAADFESSASEYLSRADNADLSTGDIDFTFAAWVNLESKSAIGTVLAKAGSSGGADEYYLIYNSGNDRFFFLVSQDGTNYDFVSANNLGSPSAGTWYHVVAWHDSVNNQIGIAVNGGTADTASHSTGVVDGAGEFRIGHNQLAGGAWYWDGLIDEVGFWKRVLTSGERTQLYNGGAGLAYPFAAGGTLPSPRVVLQSVPRASFF